MWPDRVLNTGPLALESDVLPTALYAAKLFVLKDPSGVHNQKL